MFEMLEDLEGEDSEVQEANISISKSSFDTVSAFSNINSWKDYYKGELLRSDGVDLKGFSPRNLKYMKKFAQTYPDFEFMQQLAAQIP